MLVVKKPFFALPLPIRSTFNWNAIESILYQSMLTAHLWALSAALPVTTFGLLGTFFAAIYGITTLCALGFEGTLAHFFKSLQSRKAMAHFFCLHMSISGIALLSSGAMLLSGYRFFAGKLPSLTVIDMVLILTIVGIELIRRMCRATLQLALKQRPMAYLEVTVLASYSAATWTYIKCTSSPSIAALLSLLGMTMGLSCIPYILQVYTWISSLPIDHSLTPALSVNSVGKRILISMHQALLTATSSNLLIPLYACSAGPAQAAQLKLISQTVHSIILIIHHSFGLTGLAHLARSTSPAAHITITDSLNNMLYPLIAFLCGGALGAGIYYPLAAALCFLLILQPLTLLYYQFAIIRGAFYLLLSADIAAITLLSLVVWHRHHLSFLSSVIVLSLIQLSLTSLLSIITRRLWNLPTPSRSCLLYLLLGFIVSTASIHLFTNIQ